MNIFYIYKHIRKDTGLIFYIGKGSGNRYKSLKSRNTYWKNIVSSCGYIYEIIEDNLTEIDAFKKEIELISYYKTIGQCEANLTMGGEGAKGRKFSKDELLRCSIRTSGKNNPMYGKPGGMKGKKHTQQTIEKLSKINKGRIRKPLSEEHRRKISLANKGRKNPKKHTMTDITKERVSKSLKNYYKNNINKNIGRKLSRERIEKITRNAPRNKKVIDTVTGEIFINIRAASERYNINRSTLKGYLTNRRKNITNLIYLESDQKTIEILKTSTENKELTC